MRLARFSVSGGAVHDGEVRDERAHAFADGSTVADRLRSGDRSPAAGESWPLPDVTLLTPVERPPIFFAVGLNYADHVAETGRERPARPLIFMKPPAASTAPNGEVPYPGVVERLDYEGELAAVIGAGGQVAGFAIGDDVTARDLQRSEAQWTRAKGFDHSCPWGPWITTVDEVSVAAAGELRLRTWVNGELRQDASTSSMIFDVPSVLAFLGQTCALEPGAVILMGTPSGVGNAMDPPRRLGQGDVVRIEIERLGAIEHTIGAPW
jgi:2-keto-4-pentenoate hydratase/2-oxohepta-3-ene-1,7-dioic acid hydratase in catechol pathway